MKSIIRWPGLVAFVVIVGLIAAISILFLDFWIKIAAEKSFSELNGAEVNISQVEHKFSPFGITLHQVEFTDPKEPINNHFSAETISAKIDLAPLLLRKIIIDELTVNNSQFNTERASAGEVYLDTETADNESSTGFVDGIKVPTVDEILAKSPLKTTKAVADSQAVIEKHSPLLKQQFAALPEKDKLAEYKQRVNALKEMDHKDPAQLLAAKEQFNQLKDDILKDKKALEDFKQALSEAKKELSPQLAKLKSAPAEDYQQLKSVAAGDLDAIDDVTSLVFGESVGKWSRYALTAFDLVGPMLASKGEQDKAEQVATGKWISFSDTSALPDFWIKKANISLQWQQEIIESHWSDITHQHDVLGRPTIFSVDSSASSLWQSLKLNGDLWLAESGAKAKQKWALSGLKLSDLDLVKQDKLSGHLNKGLLSSTGDLSLNGEMLAGSGLVDLQDLVIEAVGSNKLTTIVANTLNQLSQLKLNTDIGGTLGDMDLSFSSDLNQQLSSALVANVTPEQQAKLDDLKQKLNEKTSGLLGDNNAEMSQWLEWEKLADGDIDSLNTLLEAQLNNVIDKQKDKVKDKAKEKILNKIFG
ncbi:TIGR03545 family protein [Paraglaciecola sp. L3A3]|uniref:TIGR03545 family protein n=1 Tax=Paraglaciecola sp. L3A3 TaxID=2686358 RepID=UPI00131A8FE2|nr:TIGR03545 family protein [Paraglaciecola sp. L3A3]